jgi:DNA-binding LacI/PurR family transcriptional regulator
MLKDLKIRTREADSVPIYRQIAAQIKSFIIENSVAEGVLLPDIRTLTAIAGVSLKTTDRALNDLVREGICFRRPKKGTYVGKPPEASVAQRAICGVYHDQGLLEFENELVETALLRGIKFQTHASGLDIFFITGNAAKMIAFYSGQSQLRLHGVIMLGWENLADGNPLAKAFPDVRFVHLNQYLAGFEDSAPNVMGVFNDDLSGGCQMTEHLIGLGHRNIAAFSSEIADENYRQRIAGYKQALKQNGIPVKQSLVFAIQNTKDAERDLREAGAQLAAKLVESGQPATAVFCVNDYLAAGAIEFFRSSGRDTVVTGYDNVKPRLSKELHFSTLQVNFEQMGAKAVNILANPDEHCPKVLRIPPQMVVRNEKSARVRDENL